MRTFLWIISIILVLIGGYQLTKYVKDYSILSQYGKGYIWGSGLLIILGLLIVTFLILKKRKSPTPNIL